MTTALTSTSRENGVAYTNGRIYTINSQSPWAEAFIVGSNGNFEAVGTTTEIEAKVEEENLVIYDLKGQFVMPGIHDAHVHMVMSAIGLTSSIRLPMEELSSENVVEELKKGKCHCQYAHVHQDWLLGHTYLIENYNREALDKEYPDTPVLIRGGAAHSAFLNSEAMRRAGYDIQSEPDDQATWYGRDSQGHLTGEMAENALRKVCEHLPHPPLAHVKTLLKKAQYMLHRAGVTSCQEAASNTLLLHALHELDRENALKLTMHTHLVYAPSWIGEETTESLHALIDDASAYKSQHVDTRFVKIILDGVPLDPYWTHAELGDDGKVNEKKLFILNVHDAVQKYDARGMTMKIHCTGRGATRLALDAFAAARKSNPDGPRHEIAHCSGVHDDDYHRFQELNVTAEMSPAMFFSHPLTAASGGLMDWNFPKMAKASVHTTIGSDWGAGEFPDLLPCMGSIVDAVGVGDRAAGGEKICRMLTLAGAEAVGRDKEFGSIEVGKKANFVAVDRDLSKGEFDGAKILTTWFEGEIVYDAGV